MIISQYEIFGGDKLRHYLKAERERRGLSQRDVATKLGISQNYYSMIENGERQKKIDIELAQKLADIFGVTLEFICEHEKDVG